MRIGIDWRRRWRHLATGSAAMIALMLGVARLSAWPEWQSLGESDALLRLSFAHSGARNCRARTDEELAALPRNMRTAEVCDRRRAPVEIEFDLDGQTVFAAALAPSGLSGSGPSRLYRRFVVSAGDHRVAVRMRDDPAAAGFTQQAAFDLKLDPADSVAIDFDATAGRFYLH
ncbi:hypothetical protein [Defluviimonas sp. SAOS-178_SWC]|uniref:hypothetical protein n=1 Tax=Defluviimonas sp. SAOS-178_SWC TaxID=3121287 RepID=UPI0032213A85